MMSQHAISNWHKASVVQHYKDEKKQRKRVNAAWLTFLRLPLPFDVYKKVGASSLNSIRQFFRGVSLPILPDCIS